MLTPDQLVILNNEVISKYDLREKVTIGRTGNYATPSTCEMEVKNTINKPMVKEIVGIEWSEQHKKIVLIKKQLPSKTRLANSGNGGHSIKLYPGFFMAENCLNAGWRLSNEELIVSESGIVRSNSEDFFECCKIVFEEDFLFANVKEKQFKQKQVQKALEEASRHVKAFETIDEINTEREPVVPVTIEGFEIKPIFSNIDIDIIISFLEGVKDGAKIDQYVVLNGMPKYWEGNFERGNSPEEVVEKIKATSKALKAAATAAEKSAGELGLPELKGTPKQVAWALQIRDKIAKANSKDPRLKRAFTAKYWIDNRATL